MKAKLFWLSVVILMAFLSCGGEEANKPHINSVTADPSSTNPGGDVTLTCDAEDTGGYPITYSWSAEAGTLSATDSAVVTWTAPDDTGHFVIEVIIEDLDGLADTGNVTVAVVSPTGIHGENQTDYPIIIESFIYSTINISSAPSGATVGSCSITVDILHPAPAQLDIWLISPDSTQYQIWDNNYPGGVQSFTTGYFTGENVNGIWNLKVYGGDTGANGKLDGWAIDIFLED